MNQKYHPVGNRQTNLVQAVSELASYRTGCLSDAIKKDALQKKLGQHKFKLSALAASLSLLSMATSEVFAATQYTDTVLSAGLTTTGNDGYIGSDGSPPGSSAAGNIAIDTAGFNLTNGPRVVVTGGTGARANYGFGGVGGSGVAGSNSLMINNGSINGGSGGLGVGPAGYGSGGTGGAGVSGAGFNLTNNGTINGGYGGNGSNGHSYGEWYGGGSVGGTGGAGVSGSNFNLTNNHLIYGKNGGNGGAGDSGFGGGNGGNGGAGVGGFGFSLMNSESIHGGNGGVGGYGSSSHNGGNGGAGVQVLSGGISTITNFSTGTITGGDFGRAGAGATDGNGGAGVEIASGGIATITNAGAINGGSGYITGAGGAGIANAGTITTLINTGTTIGGAWYLGGAGNGISNGGAGSIGTLINLGEISPGPVLGLPSGSSFGIYNAGAINLLVNGQGAAASGTSSILTFSGNLPNTYKTYFFTNSTSNGYGKISFSSLNSYSLSSYGISSAGGVRLNTGSIYSSVIVSDSALTVPTGSLTSNGYKFHLQAETGADLIYDLVIDGLVYTGPSTANTQQSLVNTASVLQSTYTLQNSVLANSFSYDCTEFGANEICISAGGRNAAVSAANGLNNTSALLIAAYRVLPSIRVGAYADQNLSVNNAGSTVNLGNNTPLIGLFGAWNERLDGTGAEVKVSAAYGQKNTTVTRSVVGSGPTASQAGSGSSQLNSQGAQLTAKYGFAVLPEVIVAPYAGIRYTQNNMGGYTEGASSTVTTPLTYSALNTNATTALAGVGASYHFIPKATVFASAGVETDANTANGTYSGTGLAGLTPVNFNPNPVKTRPTATLGVYYDVEKNQRLGITGIYRQEPFQAVSTTTVMAAYTVGL